MALTDESSLLRERLRELQTKVDIMQKIIIQYYIDGDSDMVRQMVDKYITTENLQDSKPE